MGLTGAYPGEVPVPSLYLYHAKTNTWEVKTTIPTSRQRGSAQSVVVGDWVYFFNGITQGHLSGWVDQADRYNLATNTWQVLLPTPRARDHAVALPLDDKIYLVGGRRSNYGAQGGLHGLPVFETDVFDLTTQTWSTLPASANIPSLRAGLLGVAQTNSEGNPQLNIWGGEYNGGTHSSGLGLDLASNTWFNLPSLLTTLHATQLVKISEDTLC